jgi:hypothetical protein
LSVILDSFWWRFLIAGGGYISTLIGNKSGLLDDIYGFEDVKDLFKMAIQAERPVHLLLCGPPASAKSLFMRSLTKLERSYYAVGSSSTKSVLIYIQSFIIIFYSFFISLPKLLGLQISAAP